MPLYEVEPVDTGEKEKMANIDYSLTSSKIIAGGPYDRYAGTER